MTIDFHPEWWRRMVKLYLLWMDLPEDKADRLINALSEADQEKFDVFLRTLGVSSDKVLQDLEEQVNQGELEEVNAFINSLPPVELKKLVSAGIKKGILLTNIDKLEKEELRELVELCSLPKNFLASLCFFEGLDTKRKRCLFGDAPKRRASL